MSPCLRKFLSYILLVVSVLVIPKYSLAQNWVQNFDASTTVEIIISCGDGKAEGVEVCDPGDPPTFPLDVGTSTCLNFLDIFGDPFSDGDLDCLGDCSNFDTDNCYTCGNTNKENAEECDGSDFGGVTCITYGFDSGSLICTSQCQISTINCVALENQGGSGGGGGGGGNPRSSQGYLPGSRDELETKVVVEGKAYPHADVHMLVDGKVVGIVKADSKADFYFETTEVTAGIASFGFWSEDIDGLKSTLLALTFRVISGAVTTISGVYIAPTIDVDQKSVKKGEDVKVFGQTIPNTDVNVHIHSKEEHIVSASSTEIGEWELLFNTDPLEEDFHTAKALFEFESNGQIIKSGFSKAVSFYVGKIGGEAVCGEADLNHDGKVNITDFSILLYHWGTDNECADQNQNGTVDLIDFSIMMYYWTG